MKKRILLVGALLTALVTGLFAGDIELTLYFPVAVGGPVTATVDRICQSFNNDNPGIKVKAVYTGSYADTMVKTQTGIKSHTQPDLAVIQATEVHTLLDMDALVPLDSFVKASPDADFVKDFYPAFLENSKVDGTLWSLPFQRSTIVLYYNKALFRQAGLDPEKAPKTWDEVIAYSKKLKKVNASGAVETWGIELPSTGFQYWIFQALCLENNAVLMNSKGTEVAFKNDKTVEALNYWVSLAKTHQVMPAGALEWATVPTDFIQGKTAMMIHTTGNLTNVKKNASFDFGVAFLPAGKKFGSPTGGGNLYMIKGSSPEKQAAAWKFMRYATSPQWAAFWGKETGYVATRKSAFDTPELKTYVQAFPQAAVARDQLEFASAELSTHSNSQIYKILNDNLQAALTGTLTAPAALEKAQSEAEKVLQAYKK